MFLDRTTEAFLDTIALRVLHRPFAKTLAFPSEKLIENLNSRFIVVSFSTKTLSGKKMNFPERNWFGRMLMRLGKKFKKINFENEVFYVITK